MNSRSLPMDANHRSIVRRALFRAVAELEELVHLHELEFGRDVGDAMPDHVPFVHRQAPSLWRTEIRAYCHMLKVLEQHDGGKVHEADEAESQISPATEHLLKWGEEGRHHENREP